MTCEEKEVIAEYELEEEYTPPGGEVRHVFMGVKMPSFTSTVDGSRCIRPGKYQLVRVEDEE